MKAFTGNRLRIVLIVKMVIKAAILYLVEYTDLLLSIYA